MRLSIWSFIRMFEMWFLTVFGRALPDELDGVGARRCLAADRQLVVLEQVPETGPKEVVVVYEEDAQRIPLPLLTCRGRVHSRICLLGGQCLDCKRGQCSVI